MKFGRPAYASKFVEILVNFNDFARSRFLRFLCGFAVLKLCGFWWFSVFAVLRCSTLNMVKNAVMYCTINESKLTDEFTKVGSVATPHSLLAKPLLTDSPIYPLTHSLSHSLSPSLSHWLEDRLTDLLTYLLTDWLTRCVSHSFLHSLPHSLTHSLTHSFTHSLIHSITHSLSVSLIDSMFEWLTI